MEYVQNPAMAILRQPVQDHGRHDARCQRQADSRKRHEQRLAGGAIPGEEKGGSLKLL
jgi:hypothetical protein